MDIWVLECLNPMQAEAFVSLYENEEDAWVIAVEAAIGHMLDLDCNDRDNAGDEWNDYYNEVVAAKNAGDFRIAMKTYDEWNSNMDNYEDVYNIYIYSRPLTPSSGRVKVNMPTKVQGRVHSGLTAPKKLVDVPCKLCGRNVNISESTCWNCGIDNPAIIA